MLHSTNANIHRFNLIEVITALAIIAIIVVSALALLPKGIEQNQSAISRMTASDIGDQMLNFFASRLESNWDELHALPTREELYPNDGVDSDELFSDVSMILHRKTITTPDGQQVTIPVYPSIRIFYHLKEGISRSWGDYKGVNGPHSGLFHIQTANNLSHVDFDGYVRLWKEEQPMMNDETGPTNVHLFAEVSWPASLPYPRRTKAMYDMQVFKPAVIAGDAPVGFNAPCFSAWGIDGNTLTFYTLSDEIMSSIRNESKLEGITCAVDAMTCAPDGAIYFINNHSSEPSGVLYKISRGAMDFAAGDSQAADVCPIKVGETGISTSSSDRITGLQFINNKLYGVAASSGNIYSINYFDGRTTIVTDMNVHEPGFVVDGMTVGADGYVYVARTRNNSTELWRFTAFPKGELTKVIDITGYGACNAMAAHPTGWLFLHDGSEFLKVEPNSGLIRSSLSMSASLGDMDFFYLHELNDCLIERSCETQGRLTGTAGLNPGGNADFGFEMSVANSQHNPDNLAGETITRSHLLRDPSTYNGVDLLVTSIRFKPKAAGSQSDLMLDGEPYALNNNLTYTISVTPPSPPFLVRLENKSSGGPAMGQWKLVFINVPFGSISFCDDMGGNTVDGNRHTTDPLARIDSGALVPLKDIVGIDVDVLGCNLLDGADKIPLTVDISVDGAPQSPFGSFSDPSNSVNDGNSHRYSYPSLMLGGTTIVFSGCSWRNGVMFPLHSSPTTSNVLFIHDGQAMPFYASETMPYLNAVTSVKTGTDTTFANLAYNQVLVLYEFDTYDPARSDFQDLVLLITIKPL